MRKLGTLLIILSVVSWLGKQSGLLLPLAKWVDIIGSTVAEFLRMLAGVVFSWDISPNFDGGFCHGLRILLFLLGLYMLLRQSGPPNPLTQKQWARFKAIRRGYVSLWILGILVLIAGLDNMIVGKRALIVKHNGQIRCPFLEEGPILGAAFGVEPPQSETDYRLLQKKFEAAQKGDWVLMPLVPYDSKGDTPPVVQELELRGDNKYYDIGHDVPYTGRATTNFRGKEELLRHEYRLKDGVFHGETIGKDRQGILVERRTYDSGKEVDRKVLDPTADVAALNADEDPTLRHIIPAPTAPSLRTKHFLGTDSGGNDLLAVAYGGFQLIVGTSAYYVLFVYLVGIVLGCLMGYFGGWVDLGGQRLVEIWSAIPFLFVVILIRSVIPNPTVLIVVSLLALFGWIGIAAYMRTGTFREKARDYVAAARLQGAGTTRMIFKHIVPNTLATIVTLIPFTIDGLVFALASLDYLAFGLPAGSPSWGNILRDGTDNLNAPWIVITGFTALVSSLLLITFVGEAVREAFDPKKFTTYR